MTGSASGLFEELKRRRVFRVAAMYAVAGWVLLQIAEVTFEPLGLPDGSLRALILLVVLGFPVAIVLGWVYDWTSRGIVRTPADADTVTTAHSEGKEQRVSRPAIAVLPFENMSGDPEQDYLGDGIAEDLITRIASWDLRVVARNSSFALRDTPGDVRDMARRTGARYIVEGSVRRAGDRLRVTAQLIDGESGDHVWAESYDRRMGDLLDLQDEVIAAIAGSMGAHLRKLEPADIEKGIELARRATEADPHFASAWAVLSTLVSKALQRMLRADASEAIQEALDAARRALAIEPDLSVAHMALGVACCLAGDRVASERHLLRAIELQPEWPLGHNALGWMLCTSDEPERAIAPLERSLELYPQGVLAVDPCINLAIARFSMEQYDEALAHVDEALAQRPDPFFTVFRVAALANAGRVDEAREVLAAFSGLRLRHLDPLAAFWAPRLKGRLYEGFRRAGVAD
jgi:TolB-like protein